MFGFVLLVGMARDTGRRSLKTDAALLLEHFMMKLLYMLS